LIETILQAFDTSEALLAQYIQAFHSQVDPSPNARIDAVLLGQAMEKVKSIRRKQEALQQSLSGSTAGLYEGRAQTLRLDFIEAVEQEKILEKYLQFEQSHTHFFEPLIELVQAAKRAVDVLHQQVHFNEETGTYTVAKTFAPAMKSLQESLQKARGIDPKLDEQLENFEILAVVYKDNTGKDAVMWVLEKDGVRVQNTKLQKYIEQTGRYQDAEKYTIITLADLDKKITKAWQKGTYYMNGKVYSGGTGKVLQASAYVQEWKGKLDESGLTDVVLGLGLSTAAIRGSMEYGSIPKVKVKDSLKVPQKPSDIASGWQGYGKYPSVDRYRDIELKPGKIIYRGEPNGTEYFTTKSAIIRSGKDADKVYTGLQVEKHPIHGYRGVMQGYLVNEKVDAAFSITKANPQFGEGGLPQVFVPNIEQLLEKGALIQVDKITLGK
jgi:hypothetical protein